MNQQPGEEAEHFASCGGEPIHIPGATQPRGALLAARADDLLVTHASANLAAILGKDATEVLGHPLQEALGDAAWSVIRTGSLDVLPRSGESDNPFGVEVPDFCHVYIVAGPGGRILHLRAYDSGHRICVDIEAVQPDLTPTNTLLHTVLETFTHATTEAELCRLAVRGLKAITGWDRALAYGLTADGHGEVIDEVCEPHCEPYLGLRYPAEDIPQQARTLFLRQRVCAIADTGYTPVPLLVDPTLDDGTPLDLSKSTLRSVSPIHCEYLRNMHVATSISVAVVWRRNQDLQCLRGLLACHSATPRTIGPELLAAFATVGHIVSVLLRSLREAEVFAERLSRNNALRGLITWIAVPLPLPLDMPTSEGLAAAEADLLGLVAASGALVRAAGSVQAFGRTPPLPDAEHAMRVLQAAAAGEILAVDDLTLRCPELAACAGAGSGALLMPLPQAAGDAILWFRPEQIRTVTWAGNPDEHVTTDPVSGRLCPRGSFTAWKAVERGRAMPWREADLAIVQELRSAVETEIAERTRDELAKLRFYDPLTGLPNRSLLQERLEDLERENIGAIALLFLDLDGFKAVNDTMGHAAGDMLLIEVAERLIGAAGPDTLTVRLGGDEFVVLCPGLDCQAVLAAGERIRQTIELPFEIAGRPCHISASIGIAAADQAAGLDLIRAADMAMYVAKQAGGNQAVLFDPSQLDRASQRFELEQDMRDALSTGDNFVLLYQPLFAIADGKKHLAGFEALVRWRHPRHGWMSPSTFIPLAERSGLILPLGDWVLATALREGRALRRANPGADLIINVNVSVLQLPRPGFCGDVAGMLEAEGFPPTGLCLEITESMLTDAASAAVLAEIRALGVEIAIDDFGIGYSSLSYLRRLPVDKVKLDRSFLEDMEGDPRGIDFVSAVIALAHAAGKPVVFEGIETQAQLDIAFITGADIVQGFFFAPPLSANAAMDLVAQYRQLDVNASRLPEA